MAMYDKIRQSGGDPRTENWIVDTGASLKFASCRQDMCPCITRGRGASSFWLSSRGRKLSLRELMRLQGIRDPEALKVAGISRI